MIHKCERSPSKSYLTKFILENSELGPVINSGVVRVI